MTERAARQRRGEDDELYRTIGAYVVPQLLYVAARLGLADLLTAGPRTVEDLAEQTGAHAATLARVLRVTRLREWDALTVVPRHGFASTEDYYARASVSGRWQALCAPALLVNTEHDPMVPASTVRPALACG